jgi:hypothetical protein
LVSTAGATTVVSTPKGLSPRGISLHWMSSGGRDARPAVTGKGPLRAGDVRRKAANVRQCPLMSGYVRLCPVLFQSKLLIMLGKRWGGSVLSGHFLFLALLKR